MSHMVLSYGKFILRVSTAACMQCMVAQFNFGLHSKTEWSERWCNARTGPRESNGSKVDRWKNVTVCVRGGQSCKRAGNHTPPQVTHRTVPSPKTSGPSFRPCMVSDRSTRVLCANYVVSVPEAASLNGRTDGSSNWQPPLLPVPCPISIPPPPPHMDSRSYSNSDKSFSENYVQLHASRW